MSEPKGLVVNVSVTDINIYHAVVKALKFVYDKSDEETKQRVFEIINEEMDKESTWDMLEDD